MLEYRVLTQEDVDSFPYRANSPWCHLCSERVYRESFRRKIRFLRWNHHFIKVGEKVVRCVFRNGTVAFYHEKCWNDPENKAEVDGIKAQASS